MALEKRTSLDVTAVTRLRKERDELLQTMKKAPLRTWRGSRGA